VGPLNRDVYNKTEIGEDSKDQTFRVVRNFLENSSDFFDWIRI